MPCDFPTKTFSPPAGRPSWGGRDGLPLIYLGWGKRDFARDPLTIHYDLGTNYHILLRGEIVLKTTDSTRTVRGPTALLMDPQCAFGLTQSHRATVEVLVWIWQGRPLLPQLRPSPGGFTVVPLRKNRLASLIDLHGRCRAEVALADGCLDRTLLALRELVEVEIFRASQTAPLPTDARWNLTCSWMATNLSIHSPVPALCDYLHMSPSTLHRFFLAQSGLTPGAYFRKLKSAEALRLIRDEKWQVKEVAYHLGYRHPNDLSRALSSSGLKRNRAAKRTR